MKTAQEINEISKIIVTAAIEVHRTMGPGLFEKIYEECLIKELENRGVKSRKQVEVPLVYKGDELNSKYYLDLLVENEIVLELKTVTEIHPVFEAQILSYLKLTDKRLGFLLNFHVPLMKNGIKRFVNGL